MVTADELLELPGGYGLRHELVDGVVRVMEPGGGEHGYLSLRIGALLMNHVDRHDLGWTYGAETGFVLRRDPDTVLAPDVAFVSKTRTEVAPRPAKYIEGPPDLAVEVTSPNDRPAAIEEKVHRWLAAGCGAVVTVDPATRTAVVHRCTGTSALNADDFLDLSDVVDGFRVPLADVFR